MKLINGIKMFCLNIGNGRKESCGTTKETTTDFGSKNSLLFVCSLFCNVTRNCIALIGGMICG
jgi:hypothetical protein